MCLCVINIMFNALVSFLKLYCKDEILVCDPWYELDPNATWVPLSKMVAAMDTIDPDCGLKRGFVILTNN